MAAIITDGRRYWRLLVNAQTRAVEDSDELTRNGGVAAFCTEEEKPAGQTTDLRDVVGFLRRAMRGDYLRGVGAGAAGQVSTSRAACTCTCACSRDQRLVHRSSTRACKDMCLGAEGW